MNPNPKPPVKVSLIRNYEHIIQTEWKMEKGHSGSEWRGGSEKLAGGLADTSFQLASSQIHDIYWVTGCPFLDARMPHDNVFIIQARFEQNIWKHVN